MAHAPLVDRPTTLAAAELDDGGAASYRFYISDTSAPSLDAVPDLSGDVLSTGGLGLVLEPLADTVAPMVEQWDGVVMVDVNCRPRVVPDRDRYVDRPSRARRCRRGQGERRRPRLFRPGGPARRRGSSVEARRWSCSPPARAGGARAHASSGERAVLAERVDVVDTVGRVTRSAPGSW
ncbi:MAG: hypothetical protein R2697_02750 [Ilumatobacteraceae bacterium]